MRVSTDNIWTDGWDQWQVSARPLDMMRTIAWDAAAFAEDLQKLERYAFKHRLTINEIVYYLNADEYGGDEGLEAASATG